MSEDDNTCGEEPNNQNEYEEESEETLQDKSSIPNSYEILCHSIAMNTSSEAEPEPTRDEENVVDSSSNVTSSMCQTESKMENHEQREPVDLSGLQLLSNSIEVFHKKTFPIKQEPMDHDMHQITSPTVASTTNSPPPVQRMYDEKSCPMTMIPALAKSEQFNPSDELGGLNLLCALAEQRFQEEVGQRHLQEQDSPTSTPEEAASGDEHARKRKHKHGAIKKSSKKSKHEKARQKERKRKHSTSGDGEVDREMEETLKRVKTKYEHWQPTTTDELFQAMNQEMKEKLATITRQCEEKRRELTQIKQVNEGAEKDSCSSSSDKNEDHKPTKISYLGNAAPLKFSIIPALSPSFSSSSNSEMMIELPKLSSDTDSGNKFEDNEASSVERSKRKFGIPKKHSDKHQEHSKKSKSLVGYILASKHHPTSSLAAATSSAYDPSKGSWTCSIDNSKKVREWKVSF